MGKLNRKDIELLRFAVIGSVDHGKSTLIGRLLFDSKSIFEDQLQAIKNTSDAGVNLAYLTDGLKEEREQGITIDVAYRYFETPGRKFIISDCPGHLEFTKNMITGVSSVNLAVVLLDADQGVQEQTKRHTFIASLMNIKHLILCVNKMDLVKYSQDRFDEIKAEYLAFISRLNIPDVKVIPISALDGDNIVDKSDNMPWYLGTTLLYSLENVHLGGDYNFVEARFPIQRVTSSGFAGRVDGGVFKPGDEVCLLPSGETATIENIASYDYPDIREAFPPMSVVMTLTGDVKLKRGDMITKANRAPNILKEISLMICWFSETKLELGKKYQLQHTSKEVGCKITEVQYKVNIGTLHKALGDFEVGLNDIAKITLATDSELFVDEFLKNKMTGSVILIDGNETIAGGLVV